MILVVPLMLGGFGPDLEMKPNRVKGLCLCYSTNLTFYVSALLF